MSEKYAKYDEQVKILNDTFKVNFRYDDFESHVKKLDAEFIDDNSKSEELNKSMNI